MIIIQDILVHPDILKEYFLCRLESCQGACCWEGDFGAPLTLEEVEILQDHQSGLSPLLTPESQKQLKLKGVAQYHQDINQWGTQLLENGACIFMDVQGGCANCVIERSYFQKKISFHKPISCHLYPIREYINEQTGFRSISYDRWKICSAACAYGKSQKMYLYQFVNEAIIRKYGRGFYRELCEIAESWHQSP